MGNHVFVLDAQREPLMPCHPARARELLRAQMAAVFRRFPFTIILKNRVGGDVQPVAVKIDPGSKTTGVAVVAETDQAKTVVVAAEIEHRGQKIKAALETRAANRRSRRARKTRYRQPRFQNRTRQKGWLPPSLESRISNVLTWVARISRLCPVTAISMELVRFDMQAMENPEISGVEYQQGTLAGYELREYLLEKWGRKCAYCGKEGVPLQIEHIHPKSKGGSDRVSNLTLACEPCNQRKGNNPIEVFLKAKPEVLAKINRQAKAPLQDAAAVNASRWELFGRLKATGFPIECGTGGHTKFNRVTQGYPKAHWIDAACVGKSGTQVRISETHPLRIKAYGHGTRQRCRTDKFGFPSRHVDGRKSHLGFQTGDIVRAVVPNGKYTGTHEGRVAIRFKGYFQIGIVAVHPKHVAKVHRSDGYSYGHGDFFADSHGSSPRLKPGVSSARRD
ncbi:RNA-guided endonuclease IscB [Singulisphaera sp. Ch08]|uniref:RNA-guided endonuclease IscB n=2 Tax=Singulisphaera sp. Ch08 TaxID=3120278 RepID=A0AAU7CKE2_9BACT